jgi:hypothetical protein
MCITAMESRKRSLTNQAYFPYRFTDTDLAFFQALGAHQMFSRAGTTRIPMVACTCHRLQLTRGRLFVESFFAACCALNVPYRKGISDASFMRLFLGIFPAVVDAFRLAVAFLHHALLFLIAPLSLLSVLSASCCNWVPTPCLATGQSLQNFRFVFCIAQCCHPVSEDVTYPRSVSVGSFSKFRLCICRCSCWEAEATTRLRQ